MEFCSLCYYLAICFQSFVALKLDYSFSSFVRLQDIEAKAVLGLFFSASRILSCTFFTFCVL